MSTPEESQQGATSEVRPFNFSGVDDKYIAMIGRSLIIGIEQQLDNGFGMAVNDWAGEDTIRMFAAGVGRLVDVEPDRGKAFLRQATVSRDKYDQEMAIQCADELARRDFPLARDILAHAASRNGLVEDSQIWAAERIESWATPAQIAELEEAVETAREQRPPQIPPSLLS